jgi:hypothetical protein
LLPDAVVEKWLKCTWNKLGRLSSVLFMMTELYLCLSIIGITRFYFVERKNFCCARWGTCAHSKNDNNDFWHLWRNRLAKTYLAWQKFKF